MHTERLEKAVDHLDEAVSSASESRQHLERAADRLEKLVQVWKAPAQGISAANPSD